MSSDITEAIKTKLERAGYQVPLIDDQFSWNLLLTADVLTIQEIIVIRSAILKCIQNSQPGKQFLILI